MRVTFPRLPDHQRAYAVIERDDGAVYRLHGGASGPDLPHDLCHLVVERKLGITDGMWGGIAAGLVLEGMVHISGRPPHAAERSRRLTGQLRGPCLRAELLADLVVAVANSRDLAPPGAGALANVRLAVLPHARVDAAAVVAAAHALLVETARWARLRSGEELSYDWPAGDTRPLAHMP